MNTELHEKSLFLHIVGNFNNNCLCNNLSLKYLLASVVPRHNHTYVNEAKIYIILPNLCRITAGIYDVYSEVSSTVIGH